MKFFFCSSNQKKINDFKMIFKYPFEILNIDVVEIQEDESTIAFEKIKNLLEQVEEDGIYIVDDVSVGLKSLKGFPGPYIKYFLKVGIKTIAEIIHKKGNTEANIMCTLGIGIKKKNFQLIKTVSGEIEGNIIIPENDCTKYFDDAFLPKGYNRSIRQLPNNNEISHRAIAIKKLENFIDKVLPIIEYN